MEKNEAFRKQVLSHLYGIPNPADSADQDLSDTKHDDSDKETSVDEKKKEENPVKDENTEEESEKDTSLPANVKEKNSVDQGEKGEDAVKSDHSNNNGDSSAIANNTSGSKNITTPTTTTSHLYSVLMAPLDGRSPFRDHSVRPGAEDTDTGPRKRMRLDNSASDAVKSETTPEGGDQLDSKATTNTNNPVGMDLTKNQKRKFKKKKRKHLLNKLEVQRAKDFIYSTENEQYSVEKLRTMIEDVTEFLDAIWDVYCSEARLKGDSVEEDGYRAAAVLKCLSASGEGSWGDLQLLSRAKSVLVLRSKNLAASTISRVENELGYDTDIRNFIVRMLRFWMDEIVTKG